MPKEFNHTIKSLDDLQKFAHDFAGSLKGGDVIALSGPLGAGKTTLVQTAAAELGAKDRVTSPTFTLMKTYALPKSSQDKHHAVQLCHIDLYRVESAKESIGFEEYIGDKDYICFIEWPEKAKHLLPKNVISISIDVEDRQRIIKKQG
ncbi:tRNA (adenosine(37)-N6)-threonylcarbamoyltransferase complex ATPase subunit type 1 TsaE [bacterium]|jgi:tRNA threonylcarbamoyladenosine biosynthesis protein TsaE|nr:tRNA (adenosine(37)-N6)-threonylcarbamoyltransferase complex ATPase subunit type 1 TsaE [bacterium]MDP6571371.1 tRNA (adenosine(37)-N6)-threonylcarbamoyltransferase complex ATPase subunit type 1 TsaE [Patescibacteria group bacterium]|tara:strand:- start:7000 stop:7443 length:444 start_codon:yes stop_codon:yes gene_type:complete